MSRYYDRAGNPLELLEWAKLYEIKNYKIVKQETLPNGKWISTVWLGLDHSFGEGPPLIFETMIFPKKGGWGDEHCERYSTLDDALAGHSRLVREFGGTP